MTRKYIEIRNSGFVTGYSNQKNGSTVTTVAHATLAIHQRLITDKHFVVNMASLVPQDEDYWMVKVYAKTRVNNRTGELESQWIEFPTAMVNARDGVARKDVAHPITKALRTHCSALVFHRISHMLVLSRAKAEQRRTA